MRDEFDTAAEEARQQRATIRAQCDDIIRLRHDHATMLSNLTATQARCTEQEQRIRDQERELVELRGKQGKEYPFGPYVSGWLSDVSQHDTHEQAVEAAKVRAGKNPEKVFAGQVSFTRVVVPATAERIEDEDFTSPF